MFKKKKTNFTVEDIEAIHLTIHEEMQFIWLYRNMSGCENYGQDKMIRLIELHDKVLRYRYDM